MNRHIVLMLAVLLAGGLTPSKAEPYTDYSHVRVVRLSLVEGDVQIARPGEPGWQTALLNMPIQHGFALATGQGHAEIEFESGTTVWLAGNSTLEFSELALADGARITRLRLTQGTATFYANPARHDIFVVTTPHLEVTLRDKGTFRADVDSRETAVSVWQGTAEVLTAVGEHRLRKGRSLVFGSGLQDVLLARNPEEDEWDRWVEDRQNVVLAGRTNSARYVQSGYAYGLHDLWSYGYWTSLPGFGNCWRPWGVSYGWSPFSHGRWLYYPGFGLTWISFEPWGWLPYHYGGWYYSSIGWCWVPGLHRYWQPATVYWVRVGNQIGWVPRSPLDRDGQPPANLERGIRGVINRQLRERTPNTEVEVLSEPPSQGLAGVIQRQLREREQPATDVIPAETRPGVPQMATPTEQSAVPARPPVTEGTGVRGRIFGTPRGENPSIVYDPAERRWVNGAAREQRTEQNQPQSQERRGLPSVVPPRSSGQQQPVRPANADRPAPTPRPSGAERPPVSPRPTPSPAPGPSSAERPAPTPRPAPPPRPPETERPAPSPRPPASETREGARVRPQSTGRPMRVAPPPRIPENRANTFSPPRPSVQPARPSPQPRPAMTPRPASRPTPSPRPSQPNRPGSNN